MELDLKMIEAQREEHEAWLVFVEEWKKVFPNEDMNDSKFNPLIKSIEAWAEFLVVIRSQQDSVDRVIALQGKINAYADAKDAVR